MRTNVYRCVPMCTKVYQCIPMCTNVFQCVPMYTNVFQCVPMCTKICIPMFTNVYQCIAMRTNVYRCVPICTKVSPGMHLTWRGVGGRDALSTFHQIPNSYKSRRYKFHQCRYKEKYTIVDASLLKNFCFWFSFVW